jgi:serine/threonine-protein kinase
LALTPGTRLGVYDITAAIGEGGMGQVYRATDAKLKRQVAIKVLPPSLSVDADGLARFQREAEVLASLNHPNIAAIYGLEESGGITALVMELVKGDDLSQRIARGALPLDEALPIAKQIAEALEAAHDQGIIHRDLKPANIKVRGDGTVKVLDFGLAKALDPAGASAVNAANSPTLTGHATALGMIIGTAAYMAPEQAKGKAVDKRADIWAFGVVLYEMLAGRSAFPGETVTDIIAAVVTRDADWTALPAATPASIRRLLARCLEKDPKRRLRDIGDVRFEIDETIARGFSDARSAEVMSSPVRPAGVPLGGKLALRWRGAHWAQLSRLHWHGPARGHARPRLSRTRSDCRSFMPKAAKSLRRPSHPTPGASRTEHAAATACRSYGYGTWPAANRSRWRARKTPPCPSGRRTRATSGSSQAGR